MPKMARICTYSLCSSVQLENLFQNERLPFLDKQTPDLNNDLALRIDNNDNQMTFVGHIVCVPRSTICTLTPLGANDASLA